MTEKSTTETAPIAAGKRRSRWIWVAQVVVLLGLVAAIGWRISQERELAGPVIPELREVPLEVLPTYDEPRVVSDEQLLRVLTKLRPRLVGDGTKMNHIDHALRFWSLTADFDESPFIDGEDMRTLITKQKRFDEVYRKDEPADDVDATKDLLEDIGTGIRVRVNKGRGTSSHVDHTMASLAEVGTPLDFPIETNRADRIYRDVVEQSLRDFQLNQVEYEWSGLTYALLVKPDSTWITREGQHVDFNALADRIMREENAAGVCFGNHRLHALVMFLRIDDQLKDAGEPRLLTDEKHAEVIAYLQNISRLLETTQHPDGFWNGNWPHKAPPSSMPTPGEPYDDIGDRILATGHILEWWALAPKECWPADESRIHNAGRWMVKTIDDLSDEEVARLYTYLSHAGRALALWRKSNPGEYYSKHAPHADESAKSDTTTASSTGPVANP